METFKRYWILSVAAAVILAVAAVWLGALNQDEGWYLYAANLVSEGKMLYRDFFYTQGPLLPIVYSPFRWVWDSCGLLGARIFTSLIGILGIVVASRLAGVLAPPKAAPLARIVTFLLLGCSLYHLYYLSIPKTYALGALFVILGFYLFACALHAKSKFLRAFLFAFSAFSFALASGARISLGLLLPVAGLVLLFNFRKLSLSFVRFAAGGFLGLAIVYGPFVVDPEAFAGLCEAQHYHAARGGFSPVFAVGSLSRFVRWYAPVLIVLGLALFSGAFSSSEKKESSSLGSIAITAMAIGFVAVFLLQMLAPFPYEDYQVPVVSLLAVLAAVGAARSSSDLSLLQPPTQVLLTLGLSFAMSFGSPLLEKWTINGQDRFWSVVKKGTELSLLREAAGKIEAMDPGGKELLTQDLYLAIETGRRVPEGLEMGPFSILTDAKWRKLLENVNCKVAALSGYTFAIEPPVCGERDINVQMEYWRILKERYRLSETIEHFGQNATTLLILELDAGREASK